jgi:hypothetical protein
MTFRPTYAWILLALALALWGGVAYAAGAVSKRAEARGAEIIAAARELESAAETQRLKNLVETTQASREEVQRVAGSDIVSIADTIELAGRRAGVTVQVDDAIADTSPIALAGAAKPLVFVVRTEGTFSQVMHATRLFERLPLPSSVQQVEFERSIADNTWRMAARIQVFTSAVVTP